MVVVLLPQGQARRSRLQNKVSRVMMLGRIAPSLDVCVLFCILQPIRLFYHEQSKYMFKRVTAYPVEKLQYFCNLVAL